MRRQTVEFAVVKKEGTVRRIGRTGILQPKARTGDGHGRRDGDGRKRTDK